MKILRNTLPISDIYNLMKGGELTINRSYQRGSGLWPDNSRSYFIDTILNEYPFPKVVLRQVVDLHTKKSKREIIDGQQRLTTIRDFIDGKFKLTKVSKNYAGLYYDDLPDGIPEQLLSYEVSVDNVVTASDEEILEIFRRINSYTLPLNTSEKRHATYQGSFKWFINELTEYISPFLSEFKVLSLRDVSRMLDADLITEICQIKLKGIENRSSSKLNDIYKNNDKEFVNEEEINDAVIGAFNFIKDNFVEVFESTSISSYNFYSLMGALIFNKSGIPDAKDDLADFEPINKFTNNIDQSRDSLIRIFGEVDERNEDGEFQEYVKASIATTHSYKHRLIRIKVLIEALQN